MKPANMSRRGFLRSIGVTSATVLMGGIVVPKLWVPESTWTVTDGVKDTGWMMRGQLSAGATTWTVTWKYPPTQEDIDFVCNRPWFCRIPPEDMREIIENVPNVVDAKLALDARD